MFKKSLFTILAILSLALSANTVSSVWAEENDIMPINETSEENPIEETPVSADGEISEPGDDIECAKDDVACQESIDLETGTEPAADPDLELGEESEEETAEPELWPMYVSLGAIGAVIVIFIILNLFGRRKK